MQDFLDRLLQRIGLAVHEQHRQQMVARRRDAEKLAETNRIIDDVIYLKIRKACHDLSGDQLEEVLTFATSLSRPPRPAPVIDTQWFPHPVNALPEGSQ